MQKSDWIGSSCILTRTLRPMSMSDGVIEVILKPFSVSLARRANSVSALKRAIRSRADSGAEKTKAEKIAIKVSI